jgi:tRNA-dihydrouridine synthase B
MKIGTLEISNPVFLAPLAGITDSVFRRLAIEYGAGLVYTELISAEGLVRGGAKTCRLLEFSEQERPIGVQIFGSCPQTMARAAQLVTKRGPDLIDLNFGCPSRKVIAKNGGAALLKDLALLEKILRAVIEATDLPVTAKIRSGWDESCIVALEVAAMCQAWGLAAITVHPRTRQQGFSGQADWDLIRQVKEAVRIPVIGNGDVRTARDGMHMFRQTGCDAVMIGRGAMGNPWLFRHIPNLLNGGTPAPDPSIGQKIELCLRHTRLMIDHAGEFSGVRQMRKHYGWYTKGFPGAAQLRNVLVRLEHLEDVERTFGEYRCRQAEEVLAQPATC